MVDDTPFKTILLTSSGPVLISMRSILARRYLPSRSPRPGSCCCLASSELAFLAPAGPRAVHARPDRQRALTARCAATKSGVYRRRRKGSASVRAVGYPGVPRPPRAVSCCSLTGAEANRRKKHWSRSSAVPGGHGTHNPFRAPDSRAPRMSRN